MSDNDDYNEVIRAKTGIQLTYKFIYVAKIPSSNSRLETYKGTETNKMSNNYTHDTSKLIYQF